jgi:hypothetical protein
MEVKGNCRSFSHILEVLRKHPEDLGDYSRLRAVFEPSSSRMLYRKVTFSTQIVTYLIGVIIRLLKESMEFFCFMRKLSASLVTFKSCFVSTDRLLS